MSSVGTKGSRSVEEVQEVILKQLAEGKEEEGIETRQLAAEMGTGTGEEDTHHQSVVGAAKSLEARGMVSLSLVEHLRWVLTPEGDDILHHGSHEAKTFHAAPALGSPGIPQAQLLQAVPSASIGLGKALKAGWLSLEGGLVARKVDSIKDTTQEQLLMIRSDPATPHLDDSILKELKKRKLANNQYVIHPSIPPFIPRAFL